MKKRVITSIIIAIMLISACLAFADTNGVFKDKVIAMQPKPVKSDPVKPLPRIKVRARLGKPGEFFVKDTGKSFTPEGFNYTALSDGGKGWHATFNVGEYNPVTIESALTRMQKLGANVIRVWAWGEQGKSGGFTGSPEDRGLNGKYMENFVDFLRRANRHKIYVIPILDETPHNAYYDSLASIPAPGETTSAFTGYNSQIFTSGLIKSKCQAAQDFISYVKSADSGLLSTVLAWELFNEANVYCTLAPFSASSGIIVPANGRKYDMAVKNDRQACWDDGVTYWANKLTESIKAVDPNTLVSVGMWTSDVVPGRQPINGLLDKGTDARFPPRPSVLANKNCKLDFLDIHMYPWNGKSDVNKAAHEWDALCKLGKPVLVGEYGAFTSTPVDQAKQQVLSIRRQAKEMGYAGFLYWDWNLRVTGTYCAVDNGFADLLAGEFKQK